MKVKLTKSECGKLGIEKTKAIIKQKKIQRMIQYNLNPKNCKYCKVNLIYDKRYNDFCNHSCSVTFNNKKRKKQRKFCLCCNKQQDLSQNKYFCDNKCKVLFKEKQINENVFLGSIATIRKYIFKIRDRHCEICKLSLWLENPIPLQMDHMDGNPINNKLDNLRLLCPNCHSTTPTFGIKNKGNGRFYRRLRYKQGKSS